MLPPSESLKMTLTRYLRYLQVVKPSDSHNFHANNPFCFCIRPRFGQKKNTKLVHPDGVKDSEPTAKKNAEKVFQIVLSLASHGNGN